MNRRRKSIDTKTAFTYAAISVIPFAVLAVLLYAAPSWLGNIDRNVMQPIIAARNFERTQTMIGITTLADTWAQTAITLIVMAVLFSMRRIRAGLWYGVTVLTGALFMKDLLKVWISRPRPDFVEPLITQGEFAFPSGHSLGSMLMFMGIVYLVMKYSKKKAVSWTVGIIGILFALLIGLSRIYLGVHFPSDVIGGFSFGLTWLFISIGIFDSFIE